MLVTVLYSVYEVAVIGIALCAREKDTVNIAVIAFNKAAGKAGPVG